MTRWLLLLTIPIWTLTTPCEDDAIAYTPPPDEDFDEVCAWWGGDRWQCERTLPINIGCFDGTVRLVTRDTSGNESEPMFIRWEGVPCEDALGAEATGRCMSWEVLCQVGGSGVSPVCVSGAVPLQGGGSGMPAPQNLRLLP